MSKFDIIFMFVNPLHIVINFVANFSVIVYFTIAVPKNIYIYIIIIQNFIGTSNLNDNKLWVAPIFN